MKRKLWLIYVLFMAPFVCFSQNILKGIIVGKQDKSPLIGANIAVGKVGTISDVNGNWELNLSNGKHILTISYTGFETSKLTISIPKQDSNPLIIELEPTTTLLQTATVTSGKFEKPLGEVTVSLDVIKPRLIDNVNATSVDEAIDKIPGVQMVDGQANIRGGSGFSYGAGSRVMLLVDDIPALQADAGTVNWDDLPVENIEQVEILKGAASSLYGSSAMNGIINIRTAYAKSEPITKIATFSTFYMNPQDTSTAWWLRQGGEHQPFALGVSAFHSRKIGKFDLVTSGYYLNRNETNQNTYTDYGRLTFGGRYHFSERLFASVNVNFNKGESSYYFFWKDGGRGIMQGFPTTITVSNRTRIFIDPSIQYFDKYGNRHKVLGRIYNVNNEVSGNKSNQSLLYYAEYQFQRQFKNNWVLTSGIANTGTKVKAELYGDSALSSSNLAGYLQLEKKWRKWNFSLGGRYERNTILSPEYIANDTIPNGKSTEAKPVFRFGTNYQAHKATFIRASIGQGYRFPTIAEKFIQTNAGFNVLPNTKLTSETGWTAELGVKQGFRIDEWEGFADVSGFWQEYDNMMEFTFVPQKIGFQSQNIGGTVIKGVECSVMGRGRLGQFPVNVIAGYTYIDPKYKNFGAAELQSSSIDYNVLKYRFKHSIKFDVDVAWKSFSLGFTGTRNSHMEAVDKVFEIIIPGAKNFRAINNKGFFTLDVRLNYKIAPTIQVALITKNIMNRQYSIRPGLLEAPRNITLRLDCTF